MEDQIEPRWRKASYSGNGGGSCVEVARNLPRVVAVRDSKDPARARPGHQQGRVGELHHPPAGDCLTYLMPGRPATRGDGRLLPPERNAAVPAPGCVPMRCALQVTGPATGPGFPAAVAASILGKP